MQSLYPEILPCSQVERCLYCFISPAAFSHKIDSAYLKTPTAASSCYTIELVLTVDKSGFRFNNDSSDHSFWFFGFIPCNMVKVTIKVFLIKPNINILSPHMEKKNDMVLLHSARAALNPYDLCPKFFWQLNFIGTTNLFDFLKHCKCLVYNLQPTLGDIIKTLQWKHFTLI